MTTTQTRMQQRRDSTADWEFYNPVLLLGEMGYDTDLDRFKIGDGSTVWTSLPYLLDEELATAQASADAAATSAAEAAATAAAIPATTDPVLAGLLEDEDSEAYAATLDIIQGEVSDFATNDLGALVAAYLANPTMPSNPSLLGQIPDSRLAGATGVAITSDYRYAVVTCRSFNRVTILDIRDPASPTVVSSIVDATNLLNASAVAIFGTKAVVVCSARLATINIADPTTPAVASVTGITDAGDSRIALSADGNTAFIAQPSIDRVTVANVSNVAAPTITGSVTDATNLDLCTGIVVITPTVLGVAVRGTNRFTTVSVSTPSAPTVLGSVSDATLLLEPRFLHKWGNTVAVLNRSGGRITVVDVSVPATPVIKGSAVSGDSTSLVGSANSGPLIFVSAKAGYLLRADFTDPNNPSWSTKQPFQPIEVFGAATSGGGVAISGPIMLQIGNDYSRVNVLGAPALVTGRNRRTDAALGDSLTEYNGRNTEANSTRGFVTWANIITGQIWRFLTNGGVAGENSQEIRLRTWSDLTVQRPGVATILVGRNDPQETVPVIPPEQSIANIRAMVTDALAAGSRVVLCTMLATVFDSDPGGLLRADFNAINDGIREIATEVNGVTLCDFYAAWDNGSGEPITGYSFDGTHMTPTGAKALGVVYAAARTAAVAGLGLAPSRPLGANLAPNPTLSGTGGTLGTGASGVVADSATVTQAVASKLSANVQRLVVGASLTATFVESATVAALDVIIAEVTLDTGTFTNVTECSLKISAGAATPGYDMSPLYATNHLSPNTDTAWPLPTLGTGVVLRTKPIVVPAGTTSADLTLTIKTGTGGTATVDVKAVAIRKTTPL